ncbi:hypothetical protein [Chitinophaga arvensicola]|uniref:Lipocalin-like domain-containing protein n=1 Tax=Chitinophaga arvensicola TaxID=29529 RepID=A0A1I0RMA4_9BACT|nr:hypothetical protein [Chitinophaga arvensicola]SEW42303.1 hypothetical protein SAMN04488122_3089 [Chitinophaga arvensicola]
MRSYTSLLLMAVLATTFVACGKLEMATPDTPPPVNPPTTPPVTGDKKIEGTWNFVGVKVNSTSTTINNTMKATLRTDYTTFNNKGVCSIDGSNFSITGLSYSIDAMSRAIMYMDGQLVTDMDIPFVMTMDPYSGKAPYKRIGTDSIYFSKGLLEMPSSMGGVVEAQASGGKISWRGDTLVITTMLNQMVEGSLVQATAETKLVKKP